LGQQKNIIHEKITLSLVPIAFVVSKVEFQIKYWRCNNQKWTWCFPFFIV